MSWWWRQDPSLVYWIASGLVGVSVLVRWLTRCRHPNPHYVRPVMQRDEVNGQTVLIEPARYVCYECAKTWLARQRDPAWTPSHVVTKFSGHDLSKAVRAATRAEIEEEQRRFLAVKRIVPDQGTATPTMFKRARRRNRLRAANVIDLNSRKPA